jgi:hypothetical protein
VGEGQRPMWASTERLSQGGQKTKISILPLALLLSTLHLLDGELAFPRCMGARAHTHVCTPADANQPSNLPHWGSGDMSIWHKSH